MAAKVWHALIPVFFAAAALMPVGARAGDLADLSVLGFGTDGKVFAFEEYGVQDGSGFPFSHIYVIDTDTDSWLPGTPIRVTIDQETVPVATARTQARAQAAPILQGNGVDTPAVMLASNPLGEYTADPARLTFGQPFGTDPLQVPERRFTAALDIYDAETPGEDCETFIGAKPKGFRLTIRNLTSNAEAVLHQDSQIPQSRGCPITYRISDIAVPDVYPAGKVAVIISVFKHGFEGPDRRFLAVTGTLPD